MSRTTTCACSPGHLLHFVNTACLRCGRAVGYLPDQHRLASLEPLGEGTFLAAGRAYRPCANRDTASCCNWMVPAGEPRPFCRSCRLTLVLPDLSVPGNPERWRKLELAKRRLLSALLRLGVPVIDRADDPERGLAFQFLADGPEPVVIGHAAGVVTINVAEADDDVREAQRVGLGEQQRTLLGHLRHETGHHYWDRLVAEAGRVEEFRAVFGDERADYDEALRRHYESGPPPGWEERHLSAYAAAHPWEDWAETWMHALVIQDVLWTIADQTSTAGGIPPFPLELGDFPSMLASFRRHAVLANAINRSIGLADAYPFVITPAIEAKLAWIHGLLASAGRR